MHATLTDTPPKNRAEISYDQVQRSAEEIKNGEPRTLEIVEPGDVTRQGDLYIIRLEAPLPRHVRWEGRQLALGNTQGSRHIAEGDCECYQPDRNTVNMALHKLIPPTVGYEHFIGPCIDAKGPLTVAHPEHADVTLPPGTYLVTTQRVWADALTRTID